MATDLHFMGQPTAGFAFQYSITASSRVNVTVYVDDESVSAYDCPDPPCHEMLDISPGWAGSKLRFVAESDDGSNASREFIVRKLDTPRQQAQALS
jgi:hypothetical protein